MFSAERKRRARPQNSGEEQKVQAAGQPRLVITNSNWDAAAARIRTMGEPGEAYRLVPVEREDGDSEEIGSLRLDVPGDPAPGPGAGVHQPRVMAFLPEDGDDGAQAQGREAGVELHLPQVVALIDQENAHFLFLSDRGVAIARILPTSRDKTGRRSSLSSG